MDEFRARNQQLENAFKQIHDFQILYHKPAQLDYAKIKKHIPETNMSDKQFEAARQ